MLGKSTPVKSFPSHAINDPKIVDMRADPQLMTQEHYYYYYLILFLICDVPGPNAGPPEQGGISCPLLFFWGA